MFIFFASLFFSLSFFMIRVLMEHNARLSIKTVLYLFMPNVNYTHKWCMQKDSAAASIRLHKKDTHGTATGHIHFRFLQSVAIPIIFPPTWYLISNEP